MLFASMLLQCTKEPATNITYSLRPVLLFVPIQPDSPALDKMKNVCVH